ncbi:TPA: MFS transporter [Candidatus Sumerlaeota bacterium]|jgi:glycoside/pentoside/hexuronide:cation symporter, GPH family|nr:MFS transporter [Candidatus Sumerlaeota bacterium]
MKPTSEPHFQQKLSFSEKAGYSAADAAANFVFMTMILFQTNFYTDTFGLTAGAAAGILLWPRLWDAVFDPIMGVLADRTKTRWGRFRPWIIWTAIPWAIVMVAAYTTPKSLQGNALALMAYAGITNTMLMTLYSMNNMPYSALGGVMTADLDERAKLNSYRFIAVNIAQFIVGGFTLPLVAKFAVGHDRAYGWQMTMGIWAVLCLVLFCITFFSTHERIQPVHETKSSPKQDFSDLLKNVPWRVMALMTLIHFGILSFRGGATYAYYHQYVDKAAMFDFVEKLGFTAPALEKGAAVPGGLLETLGYVVHGSREKLADSNVADVFNSIVNMLGTLTTIIVIMLSASFARRFGKKAVAVVGFALSTVNAFAFYVLQPTNVYGMVALTFVGSLVYAPTVPLVWAIFADVADYSEWKTGRRFTGMVYATIGFALKGGLALGSASYLWIMQGFFSYDTAAPAAEQAVRGYRACSSIVVGILFAACTVLLTMYKLNKRTTIEMADELAERRRNAAPAVQAAAADAV